MDIDPKGLAREMALHDACPKKAEQGHLLR